MNTNEVELAMLELSERQKYEVEREWKKHFTAEKEKIKQQKEEKVKNSKKEWTSFILSIFFIISLIISFVVCCFYQSVIFEKFEENVKYILAGIFLFPGIFLILLSVFYKDVSKENINFYNEYKQEFMLKKIEEIKSKGTDSNDSEEMLLIIKLSREKEEKIIKEKIKKINKGFSYDSIIYLSFTLFMLFLPIFEMSDLLCLVGFEKNETLYNLLTKKIFTDGKDTFFKALLFEYEQGSFSYIICKIFPYMINIIVYLEAWGLLFYRIEKAFGNIANKEEIFEIENLEINAVGSLFSVEKMFEILLSGLINLIMYCPILLLLLLENQIYFELSTWGIIFCVMSSLAVVCKVTTMILEEKNFF